MSRRGARLSIAVLFAVSIGAAAWQYWRVERALGSHRTETAAFDRDARALALGIADLRASQHAYVATGQGADYWTARVSTSLTSLKNRLTELQQHAQSSEGATRLDAAAASLGDFSRMDRRARDYASTGQRLLASDLIFADGSEMTQAVTMEVEGARTLELAHRERKASRLENEKRLLAGGTAAVGLLFMLILAGGPRTAPSKTEARAVDAPAPIAPEPARSDATSLGLREPTPGPAVATVDLKRAAELCVDLARVSDTQQIPVLLERAAQVLDASGIVVWIADPDGRELVPTVAHGYPAAAIARVGAIPRDADNATAAAFREARVHIVKGDVLASGAIVAPLVAPGGCLGVMAAEVRREREQSEDVRAVAAIVAAQLAALIGVTPAATTAEAHARAN